MMWRQRSRKRQMQDVNQEDTMIQQNQEKQRNESLAFSFLFSGCVVREVSLSCRLPFFYTKEWKSLKTRKKNWRRRRGEPLFLERLGCFSASLASLATTKNDEGKSQKKTDVSIRIIRKSREYEGIRVVVSQSK
jgi:hypothetical protein